MSHPAPPGPDAAPAEPRLVLAYDRTSLLADAGRAAGGVVLALLPFTLASPPALVTLFLLLVALLFAGFGLRVWLRWRQRVVVEGDGVAVTGPLGRYVPWAQLERLDLRYYSTRRDRAEGWMELTLKGGGSAVTIGSELDRFEDLLTAATLAARARDLPLSEATRANLLALGLKAW